jgi:propanol-preferring alcohol dehydrogenase
MRAMTFQGTRRPLRLDVDHEDPRPGPGQIRIRVQACGVCRTDLHIVDGELPDPKRGLIPGHEIVGVVESTGPNADRFRVGARVGVPWLGWACGECPFCRSGRENLCDRAEFTGYQRDGGYAALTVADERFAVSLAGPLGDIESAPLLCAGMIGFRALRHAGEAERVGFYGFGVAAHLAIQVARHRGQQVYTFTRPGDHRGQAFARSLGAVWAGGSDERPPETLDAAVIFAPVGALVPTALGAVAKGGTVVCAGIHMSDIPAFPYSLLWGERSVRSVANLTRKDAEEFLEVAKAANVRPHTTRFRLGDANEALEQMRSGRLDGAAVLVPGGDESPDP